MERSPGDHRTAAGPVNESKRGQPQAMNFVSKGPDNRARQQGLGSTMQTETRAKEVGGWNAGAQQD